MTDTNGSVRRPGLDNHGMGTILEERVHGLNGESNEGVGEHWTPRDAVRLMANLIFLPIADPGAENLNRRGAAVRGGAG